jgi:GntR family transcriptional regulator
MQTCRIVLCMTTGPTDARPLQVRIADDIRAKIETGELAPGEQLPTYDELAKQYLCSLTVVRRAVDLLKQQGLLITKQGTGTFVRERPRARRHGMDRYSRARWSSGSAILIAEAAQQGHEANQLMRFLGTVPAPTQVAERLEVEPGDDVHVRRRTTLIDGRPNQLADSYYTLELAEKVPAIRREDTGPGGGFARIEEAGILLARIREEIAVRMPTGPETAVLRLPEGTPVAELVRTVHDAEGHPVEVMIAVIAGDMVSFDYDFPVPD